MKQHNKKLRYQTWEFEGTEATTFEERVAALKKIGTKAEQEFAVKYKNINTWFTSDYDQLHILSFCMRYFLIHEEGYDEEAQKGSLAFPPYYLEILQAIALSHSRVYSARPLWDQTEKLLADMKEIGKLIQTKLYNFPDHIKTEEELHSYKLRTDVIGYNLAVRNWAYHHQMYRVVIDMATAIRQKFINVHGADPVDFIMLLFKLGEVIEERVNIHIQKLHAALSLKTHIEIQKTYQQIFETVNMNEADMNRFWKMTGRNLSNLRAFLLAHSDLRLPELFSFTLDELEELSSNKINKQILERLFDQLSYQFGELKDFNQEYIILGNPVHDRPFIKTEDGYFSSLWTIIPHLSLSLLENLVAQNDVLRTAYDDCKAQYLEDQVELLLRKSFPGAQIFRGSKWHGNDGKDYENDLLVVIDSFALVVEAKSGIITKAAKRGAPDRLFKTLKHLIEEPSEQALRFIEYLKANKGSHTFKTKATNKNILDTSAVNYFIPLGVTFYHLGSTGTNLKLLVDAGITSKQLSELAPSISLTDLQAVFEILDSTAEKIHYLHRRREFETQASYLADELDLLGFYLDTGFNLGDLDNEPNLMIDLSLKSKELDPYFINIAKGGQANIDKPSLLKTDWWRDLLSRLEERKPQRWLELGYVLLNLNKSAQEDVEEGFRALVAKIKSSDVELRHNWVMFRTANKQRRYVVVIYPYLDEHRQERDETISTIIGEALEEAPESKGIALIGINIDQDHYPYSILAGHLSVSLFDEQFITMSDLGNQYLNL